MQGEANGWRMWEGQYQLEGNQTLIPDATDGPWVIALVSAPPPPTRQCLLPPRRCGPVCSFRAEQESAALLALGRPPGWEGITCRWAAVFSGFSGFMSAEAMSYLSLLVMIGGFFL